MAEADDCDTLLAAVLDDDPVDAVDAAAPAACEPAAAPLAPADADAPVAAALDTPGVTFVAGMAGMFELMEPIAVMVKSFIRVFACDKEPCQRRARFDGQTVGALQQSAN